MRTSAAGRALIEAREGRRLSAYHDSQGVLTIGVGHTGRMAPPVVTSGMTVSEAQCDAMLAADLTPVEDAINAAVRVPLSQNEFDALVSLGFNIGVPALRRSRVIAQINLGDFAAAADAFLLWSKPPDLKPRRRAERAQFRSADAIRNGSALQMSHLTAARGAVLSNLSAQSTRMARSTHTASGTLILAGGAGAIVALRTHAETTFVIAGAVLAVGLGLAPLGFVFSRRARALLSHARDHFRLSLPSPALVAVSSQTEGTHP